MERFRQHFAGFEQHYALIGGVASALVMEAAGLDFRATKDFDIVLCTEALEPAFGARFWRFIELGGYQNQQRSTGEKIFYRFDKPSDPDFPYMLELFSRNPDYIQLADGSHRTPLPIDEGVASLSAILLNEDYYKFLQDHIKAIDGIPVVSEFCLIPLKASAWLDLTRQAREGIQVDDRNIRKHRNDVLRLYQLLRPDTRIALPATVAADMRDFLQILLQDTKLDLRQFDLAGLTLEQVVGQLSVIYQL